MGDVEGTVHAEASPRSCSVCGGSLLCSNCDRGFSFTTTQDSVVVVLCAKCYIASRRAKDDES